MNSTYLLLGSNMGNSEEQLKISIAHIKKSVGRILNKSSLYATAAWGNTEQPDFVNQVLIVETSLSASETLEGILEIEKKMGRIRTIKNAPRIIDIDILFFNREIIDQPHLTVPHPEIQNRRFVLTPLNELSPNLVHPVLHKPIHVLLENCPDSLGVKKF
ncbi:MAG: 2-amino-4-hydroxy-6-hydroxymethyldihydropteridine diphosphokinase [Ferruginibacter sp.]|nr:2-amino-4-hydroxy-6-hydroxymethyldihydropteridine diphosphokinase [Ferruginibacter sp.]